MYLSKIVNVKFEEKIDEVLLEKENKKEEEDVDSNILEIEKLRDDIKQIISKLPKSIGNKLRDRLNMLIDQYNENIKKCDNNEFGFGNNYFSYDIALIYDLKSMLNNLSNKMILINLLDSINSFDKVLDSKDIDASGIENETFKEILTKLDLFLDNHRVFVKKRVKVILNKYKELINKDLGYVVVDSGVSLSFNNVDYKLELDKELISMLDSINEYYNDSKEYILELNRIKVYLNMVDNNDFDCDNKDDIIIEIINMFKDGIYEREKNEFRLILNKYYSVLSDSIYVCVSNWLDSNNKENQSLDNIRLVFIEEINNWFDKFKFIKQLGNVENLFYDVNVEEVRVNIGIDYGVCIHSTVRDIMILLDNLDSDYKNNKINEIKKMLDDYKNIMSKCDYDKLSEEQEKLFNLLSRMYFDIGQDINRKREFIRRRVISK